MGYNDQQNGYYGGNRPNPNDTQANYDYIAGQNKKNAEDHAARMQQITNSYTPPATTSYSSAVSSPSYTTPSSSSSLDFGSGSSTTYVSSGGGGRSMAGSHLYDARAEMERMYGSSHSRRAHKTPWVAIVLGVIVGTGVAIAPFAVMPGFYHSPYLDKMMFSMAVFTAGLFWALVELVRGRGRLAVATALMGFIVPELLWFQTGRTFLQAYSVILTRALDHLAK